MEAVNGSQLYGVQQDITNIHQDITKLGDRDLTLSALCRQRWQACIRVSRTAIKASWPWLTAVMAGKSALAVGGFYAPNEKVMFSLGLGISEGGSKMGNFGTTWLLDRAKDRKKNPEISSTLVRK